jgi:hypothetical protein
VPMMNRIGPIIFLILDTATTTWGIGEWGLGI